MAPSLPVMMPTQQATGMPPQIPLTQHAGVGGTSSRRVRCSHPGCNTSVSRPSDLARHMKIHEVGPKRFDCLAPHCRRKGLHGFPRKDKMREHYQNMHG